MKKVLSFPPVIIIAQNVPRILPNDLLTVTGVNTNFLGACAWVRARADVEGGPPKSSAVPAYE